MEVVEMYKKSKMRHPNWKLEDSGGKIDWKLED